MYYNGVAQHRVRGCHMTTGSNLIGWAGTVGHVK